MGNTNVNQRGFTGNRGFGWLNATRQYLRFLTSQGVTLPNYGTRIQWDNFIRILSPRPTNASMIQPRNLSAYYANDPTALILDGSNNVILWEDWSGNSATNTLCLNGVVGNYASVPDSNVMDITGDIDIRANVALVDWSPATAQVIIAKEQTATTRSYRFTVQSGAGQLQLMLSPDGSDATKTALSSSATGFTDLTAHWIRVTWRQSDGRVQFFTSENGTTWSQLGIDRTVAIASIFSSTSQVEMGARAAGASEPTIGCLYRAQVYNGVPVADGGSGATLAFDANFATCPKLATSFTESSSNAATVTINSTGDTGAHVAGERDLYQGTAANRPAYTAAVGRQRLLLTFDGVNDYLKSPVFTLSQPETVYFVGKQITWTSDETFLDGSGFPASSGRMLLLQSDTAASPNIALYAGVTVANNANFPLQTNAIICAIFNGAASSLRVNRSLATTGNPGSVPGNGVTVGGAWTPGFEGNIAASEIAVYADNHNAQTQTAIVGYLSNKYSIGL